MSVPSLESLLAEHELEEDGRRTGRAGCLCGDGYTPLYDHPAHVASVIRERLVILPRSSTRTLDVDTTYQPPVVRLLGATCSPEEARDVAAALVIAADEAEVQQ